MYFSLNVLLHKALENPNFIIRRTLILRAKLSNNLPSEQITKHRIVYCKSHWEKINYVYSKRGMGGNMISSQQK